MGIRYFPKADDCARVVNIVMVTPQGESVWLSIPFGGK